MSSYKIISFAGKDLPESYKALIFSKWLRSLRYGNDYFKLIDSDSYYHTYHKYISSILGGSSTIVRLAVLSDDADVVLGFSVHRNNILDYVHVHKDQRKQGIAKSLIPLEFDVITHLTKTAMQIWPKLKGVKFNPFA